MAKYEKPEMSFLPIGAEPAVPIQVTLTVWVRADDWRAEYGMEEGCDDQEFKDAIQDWVVDEVQGYGVDGDNWPNVERVTQ